MVRFRLSTHAVEKAGTIPLLKHFASRGFELTSLTNTIHRKAITTKAWGQSLTLNFTL
jgi:hypothetical protein